MDKKRQENNMNNETRKAKSTEHTDKQNVEQAHDAAEHDIAEDPDFSKRSKNDDLDEGESARLGEDNTGLI